MTTALPGFSCNRLDHMQLTSPFIHAKTFDEKPVSSDGVYTRTVNLSIISVLLIDTATSHDCQSAQPSQRCLEIENRSQNRCGTPKAIS